MIETQERREACDDLPPVDMLEAYFKAHGWPVDLVSEEEVSGKVRGSWSDFQIRAIWRPTDKVLQLICLPDIKIPQQRLPQIYELLALVNEQMWLGHFDCWSMGGVLVYRHAVMLGDEGLLSLDRAQTLIETALEDCDRFYPAFQFVLWGEKEAREALDSALVDALGEA